MVFYISGTVVFNNSAQIDWSNITDRPQWVATLSKSTFGDGASVGASSNVAYSAGTLTIWFNTNCNCVCVCDCGGGDGGGCFVAGSRILMATGQWKFIQDVQVGERVVTLTGIGTVTKTPRYKLGTGRKVIAVNSPTHRIVMSDDHSLWTAFADKQWWGTYNYPYFLWEMNNLDKTDGEGPQLVQHSREIHKEDVNYHATVHGFEPCVVENLPGFEKNTDLFHLIVDKGSYIVDGFVVSSSPKDEYYTNARWN